MRDYAAAELAARVAELERRVATLTAERDAALKLADEYAAIDELMALPIVPEDPEQVTGPEVGTRIVYHSRYERLNGKTGTVIERSYVWGPDTAHNYPHGRYRGMRRYDWSVVEFNDGSRLVVDDADCEAVAE